MYYYHLTLIILRCRSRPGTSEVRACRDTADIVVNVECNYMILANSNYIMLNINQQINAGASREPRTSELAD